LRTNPSRETDHEDVLMKASDVAEIAYREFMKGKTTIVPGLRNKILAFGARLGPRKLLPVIVRLMQDTVSGPSKPA
jgi:short-subunit dehydrogenase